MPSTCHVNGLHPVSFGNGISISIRPKVRERLLSCRLCVAHPHIVQFKELFLGPTHLAIVMEFAAGGDMFDYVIRHKGSGWILA